jgi:sarcosine oxidase subunit alpha
MVRFTFDGGEYEGIEGEPLAVALLAVNRRILSRSFRFHRPRGLMCSTGGCGWCECEVDGRPSVRSCREPVRAGLVARGEHALPTVERDVLSFAGLLSRWIPPTFYHRRFLRPRALRKRYLDVLRWFGGRGRLAVGARSSPGGRPTRRIEPDVLIVGGGRAGLSAALGAAEAGAQVVVIEADRELGGSWRVEARGDGPTGTVADLARNAAAVGVEILAGVAAIGWYDGMIAALGEDARYEIHAGAVVAATGSYDRVPVVPGADRPGVMAARTVAWLVERHGIVPGERALLVGAGEELAAAAQSLRRAGVAVTRGPVPTASLVSVGGRRRVTGVVVGSDEKRRRVKVDLVVFADRSPNLDLILAAGAAVETRANTVVPVSNELGATTVPVLFVAGSAAGRPMSGATGAATARLAGREAALRAADKAVLRVADEAPAQSPGEVAHMHSPSGGSAGAGVTPGASDTTASGAIVCFCEDVRVFEIRTEQARGYGDPELLKRRTGALTGPCQGKYCLQAFACIASVGSDGPVTLPTARPPLRPVRLGDLLAADEPARPADVIR